MSGRGFHASRPGARTLPQNITLLSAPSSVRLSKPTQQFRAGKFEQALFETPGFTYPQPLVAASTV